MTKKALLLAVLLSTAVTASAMLNVRELGAVGDGKTNDSAAFRKAFASGITRIYIPGGTYLVGPEPFVIPTNVCIVGDGHGTVLKPVANTEVLFNLKSGVQIRSLSIDGCNVKAGGVAEGLLVIRRANGGVIDSVYFNDCDRACIVTDHANDLIVQNCYFNKVALGMNLQFSHRIKVLGNTLIDARIHGFQFWGNWKWESKECADIIFANNYIKNGGSGAIWGTGGKRIIMNGNIVDGAKDVGLDLEWCDDSVITGNSVKNVANAPIALFFACKRVAITGNTVLNDRPLSDKDKSAIFTVLQRKLTDKEKALPWYVRSGIWLTSPNRQTFKNDHGHQDITIIGNVIHTIDDGIPRRDIWIGAEVKNVRIESNVLSGHGIYYGGHHGRKQNLVKLGEQPLLIDNMPTPDKPKY